MTKESYGVGDGAIVSKIMMVYGQVCELNR